SAMGPGLRRDDKKLHCPTDSAIGTESRKRCTRLSPRHAEAARGEGGTRAAGRAGPGGRGAVSEGEASQNLHFSARRQGSAMPLMAPAIGVGRSASPARSSPDVAARGGCGFEFAEMRRGIDDRGVRESLREISQLPLGNRVIFLGKQAEIVPECQ